MKRALLFVFALSFFIPAANSQTYSILDLGPLQPSAINSFAQVAGTMNNEAYLWSPPHHLQSLGILSGGTASNALGLNDRGVVVGIADGPVTIVGPDGPFTCPLLQGFKWTNGGGLQGMGAILLGDTNPCEMDGAGGNTWAFSNAVNDADQVVGTMNWSSLTYVDGFDWTTPAKGMVVLPSPKLDLFYPLTVANGINNRNQMVGAAGCCIDLDHGHALYWNHQTISDLGTLGGPDSQFEFYCSNARGISDLDQIVGWSTTVAGFEDFPCSYASSGSPHAFLWTQAHGMQDLGTLASDSMSMAYAINFFGQVIGTSGNSTAYPEFNGPAEYNGAEYGGAMSLEVVGRPFVWTQRNGMLDLNTLIPSTSGWVLNTATGINAWGQIVGSGVHNGETHGFLLTPRL